MTEKIFVVDELILGRRSDDLSHLPDDMPPWMKRTIVLIDGFSIKTGKIICWLTIPLIAAMFYEITVRYLFASPTAWAYDISRMLYGSMFILGAGYALQKNVHIRSDFLYRAWPIRTQAGTDLVMYLFLYFPTMVIFLWIAADWALLSAIRAERGTDTTWMPYLGPIKLALPVGVLTLIIQGVSEVLKAGYAYRHGKWPGNDS